MLYKDNVDLTLTKAGTTKSRSAQKLRKRRPEEVKSRIIEAAIQAFARQGFSGASLRAIAREAGVTIQLLVYHFSTKEELWKQAMTEAFSTFDSLHGTEPLPCDTPVIERLRRYISDLVQFTGQRPDLLRIMIQEAGQITPRMIWLADNRTSPMLREFCALAKEGQEAGLVRDIPPARLFYAAAATASLPYSVAAEYNYLVGKNPFTNSEMERTKKIIENLIFTSL